MDRFFLNPWALAFAALAGGIVLLYILKLKRTKVKVSSVLLWETVVQDFKANAPWQRLRWNLLMLLQILAILLLALALARPFVFGTALTGGRNVVVIDTSASMLSSDARPDRLQEAIDAARQMIGDMSRNDEGMVIAAGPTPRILASFTRDKRELLTSLEQVREGAGGVADVNAALRLITSVAAGSNARVVVFSDGAIPDINPLDIATETGESGLEISFFPVGHESKNLAIVGAGSRANPFNNQYELFVALQNYTGREVQTDVTLSTEESLLDVKTVTLRPGKRAEVVLGSMPYIPDPIKVEIEYNDFLAVDNTAYITMPVLERFNVALCTTRESLLLRKVLESTDFVDLFIYDGANLAGGANVQDIDIWVVDGDAPSGMNPAASYLFISTTSHPFLPVIAGGKAELDFTADPPVVPAVVGVDSGNELLRFVNMGNLRLQAMRTSQLQPWGKVIVDATEGPLIVEGSLEGQRTIYMAFDIYESDFPLRAAFPIFMSNTLRYLGRASAGATGMAVPAGQRADFVAPLGTDSVELTMPGGEVAATKISSREYTVSDTTQTGLYTMRFLDEEGGEISSSVMPVCLISPSESNIAPQGVLRVKGSDQGVQQGTAEPQEIAGAREVRVNREFFVWLILGVMLIMSVEWYLFHTRAL